MLPAVRVRDGSVLCYLSECKHVNGSVLLTER